MDVLVVYASEHGATRSVAARVADRLLESGHVVDLRRVEDASGTGPGAVVLGSAIHNGDWLLAARAYLARNAPGLADRPVWLFSVSLAPALRGRRGRWLAAHAQVPPAVAEVMDVVRPRDLRVFPGALEKGHVPVLSRPLLWLCGARFGDFRDFDAVDSWARRIAASGTVRR